MSEWVSFVKSRIETTDQMQKSFYMTYERKAGLLVLTNTKLIFIEEKGFLRKTHDLIMELPYKKIKTITIESASQLSILDSEGKKHIFASQSGIPVSPVVVEEAIRGQMPIQGAIP
jgi:hypothetical protein